MRHGIYVLGVINAAGQLKTHPSYFSGVTVVCSGAELCGMTFLRVWVAKRCDQSRIVADNNDADGGCRSQRMTLICIDVQDIPKALEYQVEPSGLSSNSMM